jgi:hypothetical protein
LRMTYLMGQVFRSSNAASDWEEWFLSIEAENEGTKKPSGEKAAPKSGSLQIG